MKSPWKKIKSVQKYKNKWIRVREDEILRPDGSPGIFGVIETSGSSAIVTLNDKNEIYLVKQWRYPLDRLSIELPWGGRNLKETNLQCAKRELREETGLVAKKWDLLTRSSICPGTINEEAYIYLATDVRQKERTYIPEEGDQEVIIMPFQQAYQWATSKRLHDAVTIAGIFLAKEKLGI